MLSKKNKINLEIQFLIANSRLFRSMSELISMARRNFQPWTVTKFFAGQNLPHKKRIWENFIAIDCLKLLRNLKFNTLSNNLYPLNKNVNK